MSPKPKATNTTIAIIIQIRAMRCHIEGFCFTLISTFFLISLEIGSAVADDTSQLYIKLLSWQEMGY